MKDTKKLSENEDWEACDSTLQIGDPFGRNGVHWDFNDKQEKQAKKDYYEASYNVSRTGHLLGSNRVQQNFTVKAPKCDYEGRHLKTWWKRRFRHL